VIGAEHGRPAGAASGAPARRAENGPPAPVIALVVPSANPR
jgi:hypothetical protein